MLDYVDKCPDTLRPGLTALIGPSKNPPRACVSPHCQLIGLADSPPACFNNREG